MQIELTKLNKVRVVAIARKEETTPTRIANELICLAHATFFNSDVRKKLALTRMDLEAEVDRELRRDRDASKFKN